MGKMRGTRSMGRGPGKTSMRTKGGSMRLRGLVGGGSPNLRRGVWAQDGAATRAISRHGTFPAAPGAPKKVASVRLSGPQAGMTEMTR